MNRILTLACAATLAAGISACSNDPTVTNQNVNASGSNISFLQIDREGKPGVKELYLPYSQHDPFNRNSPQNDPGNFGPSISTFVTGTAGRSAGIATYVQYLLLPDALIANTSDPSPRASYLGWETGGQITTDCTGLAPGTFGGRSLTDDVVSTDLGLAFGNLATSATLMKPTPNVVNETSAGGATPIAADDHREHTTLANQHVSCAGSGVTQHTFPYLAPPV
jgi:hypothetical protein